MTLPEFCYQKAFWIILGIMVTVVTTTGGIVYAVVLDNQNRSIENAKELEKRYVPIYELMPQIYTDLDRLRDDTKKNHDNILIICTTLGAPCK